LLIGITLALTVWRAATLLDCQAGSWPRLHRRSVSLQLRVLRLGLLQDGDVGIGVFPDGEEVLNAMSLITSSYEIVTL
jgi:hypothetical protein